MPIIGGGAAAHFFLWRWLRAQGSSAGERWHAADGSAATVIGTLAAAGIFAASVANSSLLLGLGRFLCRNGPRCEPSVKKALRCWGASG